MKYNEKLKDKDWCYGLIKSNCESCMNYEICQSTGCAIKYLFKDLLDSYYANENIKEIEEMLQSKNEEIERLNKLIEKPKFNNFVKTVEKKQMSIFDFDEDDEEEL